jgi:FtsZ-binding cell division protein ZapB
MKKKTPIPPTRAEHDRLVEKVATLKATVDELRSRNETLEDEREDLLEENRMLRQKLTHTLLLDGFKDAIDSIETETGQLPAAPPPAERLYQTLPSSVSFAEFFRIADSTALDMDAARQCLLHFLAKDLLVQDGSRLVKQAETFQDANGTGPDRPQRS